MASKFSEEEHTNIEGLRDEALLFVDQALLLEETNHVKEVKIVLLFHMKNQFISYLLFEVLI